MLKYRHSLILSLFELFEQFDYLKLDVLLLGYLVTFPISEYYNEFPLKNNIYTKTESYPFNYHEFYNDLWGTQMYMISRENAKKIIDKYYFESMISEYENKILEMYKLRYEKYPTEENNQEWLDFSNYVCKRRKTETS